MLKLTTGVYILERQTVRGPLPDNVLSSFENADIDIFPNIRARALLFSIAQSKNISQNRMGEDRLTSLAFILHANHEIELLSSDILERFITDEASTTII